MDRNTAAVMRPTWPQYALAIAQAAATRSEDPWLKVGACVLRPDNSIAGVGYNGAPAGINIDWSNRDQRRAHVLHAELNALRYCTTSDTADGLLAVTHLPCHECLKTIAAYRIHRVHYLYELDAATYDANHINQIADTFRIQLTKETAPCSK
ncbi:MAG TPA: deaminase [Acidimicrobiia bacterium]